MALTVNMNCISVQNGPFWNHVLDGWNHRHRENVHYIFYEDAVRDLEGTLKNLATFLEKPLKDGEIGKLMNHLSFENMFNNPSFQIKLEHSTIYRLRRGKVGGNPEITDEISNKFDKWSEKHLKNTDFVVSL